MQILRAPRRTPSSTKKTLRSLLASVRGSTSPALDRLVLPIDDSRWLLRENEAIRACLELVGHELAQPFLSCLRGAGLEEVGGEMAIVLRLQVGQEGRERALEVLRLDPYAVYAEPTEELREDDGPVVLVGERRAGASEDEVPVEGADHARVELPDAELLRLRLLGGGRHSGDLGGRHRVIESGKRPSVFQHPVVDVDLRAALLEDDVADEAPVRVDGVIGKIDGGHHPAGDGRLAAMVETLSELNSRGFALVLTEIDRAFERGRVMELRRVDALQSDGDAAVVDERPFVSADRVIEGMCRHGRVTGARAEAEGVRDERNVHRVAVGFANGPELGQVDLTEDLKMSGHHDFLLSGSDVHAGRFLRSSSPICFAARRASAASVDVGLAVDPVGKTLLPRT